MSLPLVLLALVACRPEITPASAEEGPPATATLDQPAPAKIDVEVAPVEAAPVATPPAGQEWRIAPNDRPVYNRAATGGSVRGTLEKGANFLVVARVAGVGCGGDGWAQVAANGFVCLDGTKVATTAPQALPHMVEFDPPSPEEFYDYRDNGHYPQDPVLSSQALTPNIYGKPWRHWKGTLYKNVAAFEAGNPSIGELPRDRKLHFVAAADTSKGQVLVLDNGQVAPADDVWIYPVSRHHGRDLVADPLPDGLWPAWTIDYYGAKIHEAPSEDSPVGRALDHHVPLEIRNTPADATGHWWEVPDAFGPGKPGYVDDIHTIRHPVPSTTPRPKAVADDEVWIDVDLDQQYLMMYRGDTLVYTTVVATGKEGWGTPRGIWRITGKNITWDMSSRADAAEPYFVEDVPFVMHFKPRYAFHGVYWHWGMGQIASHGCINLAPLDAKAMFDRSSPALPEGWRAVYPTKDDPGTTVRVRRGPADVVTDFRFKAPEPVTSEALQ